MRRAFTLVELVVVIVVLAILAGAAIVRYYDYGDKAKESADLGSLGAINEALNQQYLAHRLHDVAAPSWITLPAHVAPALQFDALPNGITIEGAQFVDQRGLRYDLTPETATSPARIAVGATVSGGAGSPGAPASGGAGGGGGGGGGGTSGGIAAMPIALAPGLLAIVLLMRPRRPGAAA